MKNQFKTPLRTATALILGAMALMGATPPSAHACKCPGATLAESFSANTDVVAVSHIVEKESSSGITYVVTVEQVFKGCLNPGDTIELVTTGSIATCALLLEDAPYLIAGQRVNVGASVPTLAVNSCDYNVQLADLTTEDEAFLESQVTQPCAIMTETLHQCDAQEVLCRKAPPACGPGQVPSVEGACWGPCVEIETCACRPGVPSQCPDPNYTCYTAGHCGILAP